MKLTLGELHIYGGLILASLGVGVAMGWGWGLLIAGLGLVPLGVVIASTEREEEPAPPADMSALNTASPVAEEEAA